MLNDVLAKGVFRCAEVLRGEYISSKLAELKRNQLMSEEQINNISIIKLRRLLKYTLSYSPFYWNRLKGIDLSNVRDFDDLKSIEPVSKEELRNNIKLIETTRPISRTRIATTSGSTGIPLMFPKDSISRAYHYAAMYRGHSWYDVNIGDREARLWSVPLDIKKRLKGKLVDYFLNRFREEEYNLTEEVLNAFYCKIKRCRPKYIMGYGRMLYEFGLYLKRCNKSLEDLRLKMVKYTSEDMSEEERTIVEETCCCPVVSEYGAAEAGIISFQCPNGNHHIMSDCIHVEYLDNEDRGLGLKEILITDLNNLSFPIIRYRLGDVVLPTDERCVCGMPFPIIKRICGRTNDTFTIGQNKRYHSTIFAYIMRQLAMEDEGILQFRVVQRSQDVFCYQLACNRKGKNVEDYIINKTKQELGPNVEIRIEYFENLPREISGKLRRFVPLEQ